MNATDTLNYYKNQLGGIDAYLGKFQDVNYYKSSPCFSNSGCTAVTEWAAMKQNQALASGRRRGQ